MININKYHIFIFFKNKNYMTFFYSDEVLSCSIESL